MLIMVALAHGMVIGFMNSGIGAVYSLGEWLAGFGAFLFAATAPVPTSTADRWMKSCGYAALLANAQGEAPHQQAIVDQLIGRRVDGLILANNPNMLRLMTGLGYAVQPFPEDPSFRLVTKSL